ncbi:SEPP1 protein, partial [Polyodon spathula]|nr:SEPP1 protein [Polyodon spathula]
MWTGLSLVLALSLLPGGRPESEAEGRRCKKPPDWTIGEENPMLGIDDLRLKLEKQGLNNISYMIVNSQDHKSRHLYPLFQKKVSVNIPVYNHDNLQEDIWKLLSGDKYDFLIYDRCGRLTSHLGLPYSILTFLYVEKSITQAYCSSVCGNCSFESPDDITVCNTVMATEKPDEATEHLDRHHSHRHEHSRHGGHSHFHGTHHGRQHGHHRGQSRQTQRFSQNHRDLQIKPTKLHDEADADTDVSCSAVMLLKRQTSDTARKSFRLPDSDKGIRVSMRSGKPDSDACPPPPDSCQQQQSFANKKKEKIIIFPTSPRASTLHRMGKGAGIYLAGWSEWSGQEQYKGKKFCPRLNVRERVVGSSGELKNEWSLANYREKKGLRESVRSRMVAVEPTVASVVSGCGPVLSFNCCYRRSELCGSLGMQAQGYQCADGLHV